MEIQKVYKKIHKRVEDFKEHPLTKHEVSKALFRYISFNVIQTVWPKERTYIWINNLKFYAQIGDAGIVGNIYYKLFDYEDSMFLIDHLKKDDLFIDVGANVGHYSLLAAGICEAEVVAFEPIPTTFSKLKRNINLNNLSAKIKILNIGVGEENSFLFFTTNRTVMNSVAIESDTETVKVEVRKLDDELKQKDPIFLKIDVEGFEYFVLNGATEILKNKNLQYIIIELNGSTLKFGHTNQEIFDLLVSYDFVPIRYDAKNRITRVMESFNEDKFNTIFVKKNSHK